MYSKRKKTLPAYFGEKLRITAI